MLTDEQIKKWIEDNPKLSGDGSGSGDGDGYGSGSGSGSGYGSGINRYNKVFINKIDNLQTGITHIKGKVAKGFIVKDDLTTKNCYIVKDLGYFAHGDTLKEAYDSLQEKITDDLPTEKKIEMFRNNFNNKDKYSGHEFFKWHHILTGSCLFGRNAFVKQHDIDLDKTYTVAEFLQIVKGDYGWGVLEQLNKYYK